MAIEAQKKWRGRVIAKLTGCRVEQIWPLLEDFFNLHKWLPTIDTCYGVEGTSGQPGCIRYCATTVNSFTRSEETVTKWALEKFLTVDPIDRCFNYEILDNNTGFNSFVATMKLLPFGDLEGEGCEMDWSFVVNPVEGWRLEDLVVFYDFALHGMAKRMENILSTVN